MMNTCLYMTNITLHPMIRHHYNFELSTMQTFNPLQNKLLLSNHTLSRVHEKIT